MSKLTTLDFNETRTLPELMDWYMDTYQPTNGHEPNQDPDRPGHSPTEMTEITDSVRFAMLYN